MATNAFLQGFLQGFNRAGGMQKLSSWAAQNIAGGQYYNPENDPVYRQDLQTARELGTPAARQSFIDEYSGYVDTGDMSAEDYFFSPAEGSPEWMQNELARLSLENERLKSQYLPKKYKADIALSEENLNRARTYNKAYPELLGQQVDQGNLNLETGRFNLEQQQNLAPVQQQIAEERLNELSTRNNFLKRTLQQQLTANELQNVGLELQNTVRQMEIDRQRELTPYEIEMVKQNVLQNTLQNNFTRDTYDDRLLSLRLGNEGQSLQNQLMDIDLDYQQALRDSGFDLDTPETSSQFNWDRYVGLTPDSRPVMETVAGGMLALNPDGSLEDWTGKEVVGQGFNMAETKIVGTAPDGNPLYVNNNDIVIYQDGTPYTDEQGNQYYARRDPFDEKLIFESFNPDFTGGVSAEENGQQQRQITTLDLYNKLTNIIPDINTPQDAINRIENMPEENRQRLVNSMGMSLEKIINDLQALGSLYSGGGW